MPLTLNSYLGTEKQCKVHIQQNSLLKPDVFCYRLASPALFMHLFIVETQSEQTVTKYSYFVIPYQSVAMIKTTRNTRMGATNRSAELSHRKQFATPNQFATFCREIMSDDIQLGVYSWSTFIMACLLVCQSK